MAKNSAVAKTIFRCQWIKSHTQRTLNAEYSFVYLKKNTTAPPVQEGIIELIKLEGIGFSHRKEIWRITREMKHRKPQIWKETTKHWRKINQMARQYNQPRKEHPRSSAVPERRARRANILFKDESWIQVHPTCKLQNRTVRKRFRKYSHNTRSETSQKKSTALSRGRSVRSWRIL